MMIFKFKKIGNYQREIYFLDKKIFSYKKIGYYKYDKYSLMKYVEKLKCSDMVTENGKVVCKFNKKIRIESIEVQGLDKHDCLQIGYLDDENNYINLNIMREKVFKSDNGLVFCIEKHIDNIVLIILKDIVLQNTDITFLKLINNGVIFTNRIDGFGERMCAFLNAMYLSYLTGFDFKFHWHEPCCELEHWNNDKELLLPYSSLGYKSDIFTDSFIETFHVNKVDCNAADAFSLDSIDSVKKTSICLCDHQELFWHFKDMDVIDYRETLPILWKQIGFNASVLSIVNNAEAIVDKIGNFISIHIRAGDIIYGNSSSLIYSYKATNICLALELIERYLNKYNIIMFSDDISVVKYIQGVFKLHKYACQLFIADDLFDRKYFSGIQQNFFEICVMSKSKKIFSSDSGFSRLALMIGNCKEHYKFLEYFTKEEQVCITKDKLLKFNLNKNHQAFCYMHLYLITLELNRFDSRLEEYVQYAYNCIPSKTYAVLYCNFLLKNYHYDRANEVLKQCYENDVLNFKNELFCVEWFNCWLYRNEFKLYDCYDLDLNYSYIYYFFIMLVLEINQECNLEYFQLLNDNDKLILNLDRNWCVIKKFIFHISLTDEFCNMKDDILGRLKLMYSIDLEGKND